MIINALLVAFGGALGSLARYFSSEVIINFVKINNSALAKFPWTTFFVNIFGSILAGVLYYLVIKNFDSFDLRLKNFLFVGFLGGFTTFSAFSLDFFRLATAGQYSQAVFYAMSSVILSILAVFFGFYSSKIIFS